MLVLARKERQSVVVGDDVTVTVDEVCGADGSVIRGAAVRLGFEAPPSISILRDNIRRREPHGKGRQGNFVEAPKGDLVRIADAKTRLWIRVPRQVPVRHNGEPVAPADVEEECGGATDKSSVYLITCCRNDRITICHNIVIVAVDFHRFVFFDSGQRGESYTSRSDQAATKTVPAP